MCKARKRAKGYQATNHPGQQPTGHHHEKPTGKEKTRNHEIDPDVGPPLFPCWDGVGFRNRAKLYNHRYIQWQWQRVLLGTT